VGLHHFECLIAVDGVSRLRDALQHRLSERGRFGVYRVGKGAIRRDKVFRAHRLPVSLGIGGGRKKNAEPNARSGQSRSDKPLAVINPHRNSPTCMTIADILAEIAAARALIWRRSG